jgi:hypothetical protein
MRAVSDGQRPVGRAKLRARAVNDRQWRGFGHVRRTVGSGVALGMSDEWRAVAR